MTTYSFTAYKVTYDVNENPVGFDITTIELVFSEGVTPEFIYSILAEPPGELPEVEFVGLNTSDIRVDGVSLNQEETFEETFFGTIVWNTGGGNQSTQLLALFDADTNTEFYIPLFGADPGLTDLNDFIALDGAIVSEGPATSPFAEGDSWNVATSPLATSTEDDLFIGSEGDDFFDGGAGNDTIFGNGGSDTIVGGAGNDSLNPGGSFDFDDIRPGSGNDTINLTEQTNSFTFLYYGDFDQHYAPGALGIVANLSGGDGDNDTIIKNGTDTDTIIGLDVPLYNDIGFGLYGTDRNDTFNLTNINGFNPFGAFIEITPGDGIDSYVIDGFASGRIHFDEGADFNPATEGLIVDLGTGLISNDGFGNVEQITYVNGGGISQIQATNNNDNVQGSGADEAFVLLGGTDTLAAGDGFDRLRYDRFDVSNLVVDMEAGTATGSINYFGTPFAFSHSFSGVERIDGSRFNADDITGSSGDDFIRGRGGDDILSGSGGFDELYGEGGNDTIDGGDGGDFIDGGDGNDSINPGSDSGNFDFEFINGSTGNDTIDLSSLVSNYVEINYGGLGAPITANLDVDDNVATVDKAVNGFDTIQDAQNAAFNADGFRIVGTGGNDAFNIDYNSEGFQLSIRPGNGVDSYNLEGDRTTANLQLTNDENFNPAAFGAILNLATRQIINDGFGNQESISGTGYFEFIETTNLADSILGGSGDEAFRTYGGNDTVDGGDGFDRIRYDSALGVIVNLGAGTASGTIDFQGGGPEAFSHLLSNIEAVNGSESGGDSITGSNADNDFRGRGGNDTIIGLDGNDSFRGDDGNDSLIGGAGDDFFRDGAGNDFLDGGEGDDTFRQEAGSDTFIGGAGWDRMDYVNASVFANGEFTLEIDQVAGTSRAVEFPTNGNDSISGIEEFSAQDLQIDVIFIGDEFDSRVETGSGADSLTGNAGDDTLIGGAGNDTLRGGDGRDNLRGGDGDDLLDASGGSVASNGFGDFIEPGRGTNTILGHEALWNDGEGIDIFYGDVTGSGGVTITINEDGAGTVVSAIGGAVNDTFTFTHFFIGTEDNDVITRSANDDRWFGFQGGAGDDLIQGNSAGTDYVDYRDDSVFNGGGAVTVNLATQSATDGFGDTDTLIDIEQVRGSVFDDLLTGDSEANELDGTDGNDTLNGGDGDDTLIGGGGNDSLNGGAGDDFILPGTGTDQVNGNGGFDTVAYDDGSLPGGINALLLPSGPTTLWNVTEIGGSVDVLTDIEAIIGTGSNDTLNGANATINISLFGGDGNDSILGGSGGDFFQGGQGNDTINGGSQPSDSLDFITYYWDIRQANDTGANLSAGIVVTYTTETNATVSNDGFGTSDTLISIEGVEGTEFADSMTGAAGQQFFRGLAGNDTIDGGAGTDWASYRNTTNKGGTQGAILNFATNSFTDTYGDTDTLISIENISGSDFGDLITGNTGIARELNGHGGNDTINAGNLADTIDGGDGDDSLNGGGGNDSINGGIGADLIDGGAGNDVILGNAGNDTMNGGDGDDQIFVDGSGDVVNGGAGTDRVRVEGSAAVSIAVAGYTGVERVDGGNGNDTIDATGYFSALTILGGNGADSIVGSSEVDQLQGGAGNDIIFGGGKQDFIFGNAGADTMWGETGNDQIFVDDTGDVVHGGDGTDRVRIDSALGVILDTSGWTGVERIDGGAGNDGIDASGFTSALTVVGNGGNDTIVGGSNRNVMFGNDGADQITGGGDVDVLDGGAGADTMSGGGGDDVFFLDGSADVVNGGDGLDRARVANGVSSIDLDLTGWSGLERMSLSAGNDTLDASSQSLNMVINGLGGADDITGGSGSDFLYGNIGNDTLRGGDGDDFMYGDAGADLYFGGGGNDFFYIDDAGDRVEDGGAGTDRVVLVRAGLTITIDGTWTGIERVDAVAGAETINASGYASALTILGNAGADSLTGGAGNDTIFGGSGADRLNGGPGGNDVLLGGGLDGAVDVFVFQDGAGTDRINDFENGVDLIDVTGIAGVSGFNDVTVTFGATNTTIVAGAETIILQGITSDIDAFDFV